MKQRINLYQPSLHPVRHRYPLSALLSAALGIGLVVAGGAGWLSWQQQQAQSKLQQAQQIQQQKTEALSNLQQALTQRAPKVELSRQLTELQQELQQKQQLLQYLSADQQRRPQFAAVLQSLAAQDLPQFWLQSFSLGQRGVAFSGVSRDAADLPRWLVLLSREPYFQGRQLSTLELSPLAEGYLQFRVADRVAAGGAP